MEKRRSEGGREERKYALIMTSYAHIHSLPCKIWTHNFKSFSLHSYLDCYSPPFLPHISFFFPPVLGPPRIFSVSPFFLSLVFYLFFSFLFFICPFILVLHLFYFSYSSPFSPSPLYLPPFLLYSSFFPIFLPFHYSLPPFSHPLHILSSPPLFFLPYANLSYFIWLMWNMRAIKSTLAELLCSSE